MLETCDSFAMVEDVSSIFIRRTTCGNILQTLENTWNTRNTRNFWNLPLPMGSSRLPGHLMYWDIWMNGSVCKRSSDLKGIPLCSRKHMYIFECLNHIWKRLTRSKIMDLFMYSEISDYLVSRMKYPCAPTPPTIFEHIQCIGCLKSVET